MKNIKSEYHFLFELEMIFRLKDEVMLEKTIYKAILEIGIYQIDFLILVSDLVPLFKYITKQQEKELYFIKL